MVATYVGERPGQARRRAKGSAVSGVGSAVKCFSTHVQQESWPQRGFRVRAQAMIDHGPHLQLGYLSKARYASIMDALLVNVCPKASTERRSPES